MTNNGGISASGTGSAGVDLADGGTLTNNSTGSITGNSFGVFITGAAGTVTNKGSIAGGKYDGVVLAKGGSVTNVAGATVTGGSNGIYIEVGLIGKHHQQRQRHRDRIEQRRHRSRQRGQHHE